jgi:hypothetical protein
MCQKQMSGGASRVRINNQEQPAYSSDNGDSDRLYDT